MIRLAIVEDEAAERERLCGFIARFSQERKQHIDVSLFADGATLLDAYRADYDILLMDIQLPHLDGFSAAERIRALDQEVVIVFITNLAQYAIRGYSVGAKNFILKPVSYFSLSAELSSILHKLARNRESYFQLRTKEEARRIPYDKILYFEMYDRRVLIHTAEGGPYALNDTLSGVEQRVSDPRFFRCHSGFLINLAQVDAVCGAFLQVGERQIPLSRSKKALFWDRYKALFIARPQGEVF